MTAWYCAAPTQARADRMARAGARFVQALHEAYAAADRAREVERLRLSLYSLRRPLSTGAGVSARGASPATQGTQ